MAGAPSQIKKCRVCAIVVAMIYFRFPRNGRQERGGYQAMDTLAMA